MTTNQLSPILNHQGQLKVWRDSARFKVVMCGRRWGKTILALEWLLEGSCIPDTYNTYVAPTRDQGREIAWDYLKKRCKDFRWRSTINETWLTIYRFNGSKIVIRSAEVPERFRGKKNHRIVLDEFSEYKNIDIWTQAIRPTLSDTRGKAMFIFTPKGLNFSYELFQKSKTESNWSNFCFKTVDSPFFQTKEGLEELEDAKRSLSERDYKQEYEASFETHSGRIYYAFNREKLNTDYIYNKDNGPVYCGQDFNRSPMASALFQKVSGKLIQFDEVFIRVGDTKATCDELLQRYPKAEIIFRPDATGKRKTSNSAISDFDIIKQYGYAIDATPINPRVIDRWAATNRAYEKELVLININRCPVTVKDREVLCYKEGSCEPKLSDPMLGHISDAADYAIYREFPIILPQKSRVGFYA